MGIAFRPGRPPWGPNAHTTFLFSSAVVFSVRWGSSSERFFLDPDVEWSFPLGRNPFLVRCSSSTRAGHVGITWFHRCRLLHPLFDLVLHLLDHGSRVLSGEVRWRSAPSCFTTTNDVHSVAVVGNGDVLGGSSAGGTTPAAEGSGQGEPSPTPSPSRRGSRRNCRHDPGERQCGERWGRGRESWRSSRNGPSVFAVENVLANDCGRWRRRRRGRKALVALVADGRHATPHTPSPPHMA